MSNLTSIPHGPNTNPYAIFNKLRQAGWRHDFDTSPGNNLIITVDGAPPIGSHPGGVLFAGCWTRQDGLSVFQRSNMDRSITTVVIDPYGALLHSFRHATLIEAGDAIDKLNLI